MPLLSFSILLSFGISLGYVIVLYLSSLNKLDRNDPRVIKSRIVKIMIYTSLIMINLPILLKHITDKELNILINQLGWLPAVKLTEEFTLQFQLKLFFWDIIKNLVLISILFIGPLLNYTIFNNHSIIVDYYQELNDLKGWRDLIVGPLTEEIIYTSSIIVILLQSSTNSIKSLIILPTLTFAIAHIHHAIQLYLQKFDILTIIISTLFQMGYTFLFGIFTNFIFLRNGNIWSCFILHSFCNFISLPPLKVNRKYGWNWIYYLLLLLGIYGFFKSLWILTESPNQLIQW